MTRTQRSARRASIKSHSFHFVRCIPELLFSDRPRRLKKVRPRRANLRSRSILRDRIELLESRTLLSGIALFDGTVYSQNFSNLPASGSVSGISGKGPFDLTASPFNFSTPSMDGWAVQQLGSGANVIFSASAGTGTTGSFYSYGTGTNTDRALGFLASGTYQGRAGIVITNNTLTTYTSITIAFTTEEWRKGDGNLAAGSRLVFQYSLGASAINDGTATFTATPKLDAVSPIVSSTSAGSVDGNANGDFVKVNGTISGISWAPGQNLVLRWSDSDDGGSDDGLAIDDVEITATPSDVSTAYVNSAWSTLAPGDVIADADNATAGNQSATFGVNAFTTIQTALDVIASSGNVIVNSGTSGNYAEAITLSNGKSLQLAGNVTINSLSSSDPTSAINLASFKLIFGDATALTEYDGRFTGNSSASLVKQGIGTFVIGAANAPSSGNYSLVVNAGTIKLGASEVIADGSTVAIDAGAVLDLNGHDETISVLGGVNTATGFVLNSAVSTTATLFETSTAASGDFHGTIQDNGGSGGSIALSCWIRHDADAVRCKHLFRDHDDQRWHTRPE